MFGSSSRCPRSSRASLARSAAWLAPRRAIWALAAAALALAARAGDVSLGQQGVVRERPEAFAPIVAVVPTNGFVFLNAIEGSWARVTLRDGRAGYVPGSLSGTTLVPDERIAAATPRMPGHLTVGVDVALRANPAAGSPVTARVATGATVAVVSRLGDWVEVLETGSRSGWLDVVVTPVSGGAPPSPSAAVVADAGATRDRKAERDAADAARRAEREAAEAARAAKKAEREAAAEAAKRQGQEAEAQRQAAAEAAKKATQDEAERAATAEAARKAAEAEAQGEATAEAAKRAGEDGTGRQASDDAKREAERQAAARKADREAADAARSAEREAAEAAKKAEREAAEAAKKAEREAAEAEKRAAKEPTAAAAPGPADPEPAAKKAEREAADAAKKAEREAAEAAKKAEREAADAAKKAERDAQREREQQDALRIAEARRQAEEADRTRVPPPPVEIPPAVAVPLDQKAPNERKRDPAANPLVRAGVPSGAPAQAPPAGPAGYEPYDASRQVDRSVASLHDDRSAALGLSTGEARAPGPSAAVHVGEDGRAVRTTIVSQIVARVNDEILTSGEFDRRLQETLDDARRSGRAVTSAAEEREVKRRLLARLIEQLLLVEEAKALGLPFDKVYENAKARFMKQAGIDDDLELVRLLEATGRTWDDFRRELLRESVPPAVLQSQVFRNITVPEEDIEAHYRMHQEDFADEACVRMREIVLQPEPKERTKDFNQRLEALLESLEAGADFCALARKNSKAPSADDCGLLPTCFRRSQLDEKVALVAFRMQPGDIEPITTDWGFHVIRLEELKPRRLRPMTEVRDDIVDRLRSERANEQVRRYMDRLRESARVDVAPEFRSLLEGTMMAPGSSGQ